MVFTDYITIKTKGFTDVIDITDRCADILNKSGLREGIITVFCQGSTGGISTIEFEPNLVVDLKEALEVIAPVNKIYNHEKTWHDDNGSSHIRSTLLGPSLSVPFRKSGLLLISHCEDPKLSGRGVINKGFISTKMGLRGIPRQAEYERVKRDLELADKAAAAIHIAHVSCKESVEIISENEIKIKVSTVPERGKANKKVIELLADKFAVPKSQISILKGHLSRTKVVTIPVHLKSQ